MAFRLRRPYSNEDEFVVGDGAAISRAGMVLIGAGARPAGLIVRFEIALRDGNAVFRGEGKVVGHRATDEGGKPAGLEIRFTRLDARGKALVDRVLREREREAQVPDLVNPASIPPLSLPEASIPPLSLPTDAPALPVIDAEPTQIAPPVELVASLPVAPPTEASDEPPPTDRSGAPPAVAQAEEPVDEATVMIALPPPAHPPDEGRAGREAWLEKLRRRAAAPVPPPPEREALLGRLRARV